MKILYITSVSGTMDFFVNTIDKLIKQGNTVDVACSTKRSPLNTKFNEFGCKHYELSCSRNVDIKAIKKTVSEIKKIVSEGNYDIVHCHTPIAAFCTRIACKSFRKKGLKVVYTAHGFHFYKGAPIKNWLLFFPAEWLCSFWTDALITINSEDYKFSSKLFAKKNCYIPGVGVNVNVSTSAPDLIIEKKKELNLPENSKVIMTVGDLNLNKNQSLILKCISSSREFENLHYLVVGTGGLSDNLKKTAEDYGISDRVHFLGFRTDVFDLYSICDFTVFPSFREGLSVSIMESMAFGLPVICSDIRGNRDLIDNGKGGFLCNPFDYLSFKSAMEKLINDVDLKNKMGEYNTGKIGFFSFDNVFEKLTSIYDDLLK